MGYLSNLNRIFLINKNFELISYIFPQSFVNYQIAVLQNNFKEADKVIIYNHRSIRQFLQNIMKESPNFWKNSIFSRSPMK